MSLITFAYGLSFRTLVPHPLNSLSAHRYSVEELEPRLMLAADGAGELIEDELTEEPASNATVSVLNWISPTGGDWNDASNWDLGRVPGDGDEVTIPDLAGEETIEFGSGEVSISFLTSQEEIAITGGSFEVAGFFQSSNLRVGSGATLSVNNGELNVPTVTIEEGGTLYLGGFVDGDLTLAGMLSPGAGENARGFAFVSGQISLLSTAQLVFDIADEFDADALDTSFPLVLSAGFDVNLQGPAPPAVTTWSLLSSFDPAGVSGTFDSISLPPSFSLDTTSGDVSLSYDPSVAPFDLDDAVDAAAQDLELQYNNWANLLDLDNFGTTPFELPLLNDALATSYGLNASFIDFGDYAGLLDKTFLVDALEAQGFQIDSIEGGFTDATRNIPASSGSLRIELTYTETLFTGGSSAFGDNFNDATTGLLRGLSDDADLSGKIDALADAEFAVSLAIDESGAVLTDAGFELTLAGAGNLSGNGTVGGESTTITGSGAVDYAVRVGLDPTLGSLRLADVPSQLTTVFIPSVSGTAELNLSTSIPGYTLNLDSDHTLTVDAGTLAVTETLAQALGGTVELGFLDNAPVSAITLSGTYDETSGAWTLTGNSNAQALFGLAIDAGRLTATLSPTAVSGSFTGSLPLDLLSAGGSAANLALTANFTPGSATVTGQTNFAALNFVGVASDLLAMTDANLTLAFSGNAINTPVTGDLSLDAAAATLYPAETNLTSEVTDGSDADDRALVGTFDFVGEVFDVTLDELTLAAAGVFTIAAGGAALSLRRGGTDASEGIGFFIPGTLTLDALTSESGTPLSGNISRLELRQDGLEIDFDQFTTTGPLAVGGFVEVQTPSLTLNNFDYSFGQGLTGKVDISASAATLYPGQTVTGTAASFSGSYDFQAETFSLSFGQVDLGLGDSLRITGFLSFNYDPNAAVDQVLASETFLEANLTIGDTSGTIFLDTVTFHPNNIAISDRADPFSENSVSLGGVLEVAFVQAALGDLSLPVNAPVAGSVSLSGLSGSLFAGEAASADFQGSTGTLDLATGAVTLEPVDFVFRGGDDFLFTPPGLTLAFDPSGGASQVLASLATAPGNLLFLGGARADFNGVEIRADGLSIGSLTLTETGDVLAMDRQLALDDASLSLDSFGFSVGGPVTGALRLSSATGTLYASSFGGPLNTDTPYASEVTNLTGTFDFGTRETRFATDSIALNFNGLATLTTSGVDLAYNPAAGDSQILGTATAATAVFSAFLDEAGAPAGGTLGAATIRLDSFSVAGTTLAFTQAISVGEVLTLTNPTLTVGTLSANVAAADSGNVGLAAAGLSLYPNGPADGTATNGAGNYGLEDGLLSLSADSFELKIADALTLSAPSLNLTFTPADDAAQNIATVSSGIATLDALTTAAGTPPGLPFANLLLRSDGFALNQAAQALSTDLLIADTLQVSTPEVGIDVAYTNGAGLSGDLSIRGDEAVLYPGESFAGTAGATAGGYDLSTAAFDLTLDGLALDVGDKLTISSNQNLIFAFDPAGLNDQTLIHLPVATVAFNDFAEPGEPAPSSSVNGILLRADALVLPQATASLASDLGIPGVLVVSSSQLLLPATTIARGESFDGEIELVTGTDEVLLFPGQIVTGTGSGFSSSLDQASGVFTFGLDSLSLTLADAMRLAATNVVFTYDPDGPTEQLLATITDATATLLTVEVANAPGTHPTGTLGELTIRQNGLSIADGPLTLNSDLRINDALVLQSATAAIADLNFVVDGALTGRIDFNAPSASLYEGAGLPVTGQATDVTGAYDFATEEFALSFGELTMTVDESVTIISQDVAFTFDPSDATPQIWINLPAATVQLIGLSDETGSPARGTLTNVGIGALGLSFPDQSVTFAAGTTLGDFLRFEDLDLSFAGYQNLTANRLPVIDFFYGSARLFPGEAAEASLTGRLSRFEPLTAVYSVAVAHMEIDLSGAAIISQSNLTLQYAAQGSDRQLLHTLRNFDLEFDYYDGVNASPPSVNLDRMSLFSDGFVLPGGTLNAAQTVAFHNLLTFDAPEINWTQIEFTRGQPLEGSFTMSAATGALFPGEAFAFDATTLATGFDFATADHVATVDALSFDLNGLVTFTATDLTIDDEPGGPADTGTFELAAMGVAFPGLAIEGATTPQGSTSDFVLGPDGIAFGDSRFAIGSVLTVSDVLRLNAPTASLGMIDFVRGESLPQDVIAVSADSIDLYPGRTLSGTAADFTAGLALSTGVFTVESDLVQLNTGESAGLAVSGLTARYDPANVAEPVTISTGAAVFSPAGWLQPDGDAFALPLTGVSFDPDGITIVDQRVSGLEDLALGEAFVVRTPVIDLSNFAFDNESNLTGEVAISAAAVDFFPGEAITGTGAGLTGSFDLAAGSFALELGLLQAQVGEAFGFNFLDLPLNYTPTAPAGQTLFARQPGDAFASMNYTSATAEALGGQSGGFAALELSILDNGMRFGDATAQPALLEIAEGRQVAVTARLDDFTFTAGQPLDAGFAFSGGGGTLFSSSDAPGEQVRATYGSIGGGYDLASAASNLELREAALQFGADVVGAPHAEISLGTFAFAVDPSAGADQVLQTVADSTLRLNQFGNVTAGVENIVLRANGFEIAAQTQQLTTTASFGGNNFALANGRVAWDAIDFTTGTAFGRTAVALTGPTLEIYPGQLVSGTASDFAATVALARPTATAEVASLNLDWGAHLQFEAGASTISGIDQNNTTTTLTGATVTLANMADGAGAPATATVPGMTLDQFGVTFSAAPTLLNDPIAWGSAATLLNPALDFGDPTFGLRYLVGSSTLPESVRLTASQMNLYEGSEFGGTTSGVQGDFNFATGDYTNFDVEQLELSYADSVTITASGTGANAARMGYFDDGDGFRFQGSTTQHVLTLLQVPTADGTGPALSGGVLSFHSDGFAISIVNTDEGVAETILIGDGLEFGDAARFSTQEFAYTVGQPLDMQVAFTADDVRVFPGEDLTGTGEGVSGTYDPRAGTLDYTLRTLDMTAGGHIALDDFSVAGSYTQGGPANQQVLLLEEANWNVAMLDTVNNRTFLRDGNGAEMAITLEGATLTTDASRLNRPLQVGDDLVIDRPFITVESFSFSRGGQVEGLLGYEAFVATLYEGEGTSGVIDGLTGTTPLDRLAYDLVLGDFELTVGEDFVVTGEDVPFTFDPEATSNQALIESDDLVLTNPTLGVTATLDDFSLLDQGTFGFAEADFAPADLNIATAFSPFLPFIIGDTNFEFGRNEQGFDLENFDTTVTGSFDFDAFGALPFTPILEIGDLVLDGSDDTFSFEIQIIDGEIRPLEFPTVTIGFTDLSVGNTANLAGSFTVPTDGSISTFAGLIELTDSGSMDVTGTTAVTLDGTFNGTTGELDLSASLTASFGYGDLISVDSAQLDFALEASVQGGVPQIDALSLEGLNVGSVSFAFGDILQVEAADVAINLNPASGENIMEVATLTATFPSLAGLTAVGSNFAINADGGLEALDGFGVAVSAESSAALNWPEWLPIEITEMAIAWDDIVADPFDFQLVFSASVTGLHGLSGLEVEGSLLGVAVDFGLLADGLFPVVAFESVGVGVSGELFGGEVDMSLFLSILRLDADGDAIANTDFNTPVADSVLYGGILGGFTSPAGYGFEARFGLSELGPLQGYVQVDAPVVLDPVSGLAITGFRAGVTFNSTLPEITDPRDLEDDAFSPQRELSLAEWQSQLRSAVLAQAANPPGSFTDAFTAPMTFEGGATLYSIYATSNAFEADADLIIDTQGRIVIDADVAFGGSEFLTINMRMYGDFSDVDAGAGTLLFFMERPSSNVSPPLQTIYGSLQFVFGGELTGDADAPTSDFQMIVTGGYEVSAFDFTTLLIEGTLTLTFASSSRFSMEVDGTASLESLGELAAVAGKITVDLSSFTTFNPDIWGVLTVQPNFEQFEDLGLFADGTATLQFNTTGRTRVETAIIFGVEQEVTIQPESIGLFVEGTLAYRIGAQEFFGIEGAFAMQINAEGLDVLVDGTLDIGIGETTLLGFDANGFLFIRDDGIAASITLRVSSNIPDGLGFRMSGSFTLVLNTTGTTQTLPLVNSFGRIQFESVSVAGGVDGSETGEDYLYIDAQAHIDVVGQVFSGDLRIELTETAFLLEADMRLWMGVPNDTLAVLRAQGGMLITEDGLAAALDLTLLSDNFSDLGLDFNATYRMELNTTGQAVSFDQLALDLPAGPYFRVEAMGVMTAAGQTFDGAFIFSPTDSEIAISFSASLSINLGSARLFDLEVEGAMVGYFGDFGRLGGTAAIMTATLAAGPDDALGFSLGADVAFTVGFNTTSSTRSLEMTDGTFVTIANQTFFLETTTTFSVAGFTLTGDFFFLISANEAQVQADVSLTVFGATASFANTLVITSDGVALETALALPTISNAVITISGTFRFALNTTASNRLGLAPGTAEFSVTNAQLAFLGLSLSGSITISSSGRIDIPGSDPLTVSILGQTASLSGFIEFTQGRFDLTGNISISLGSASIASLSGGVELRVFRTNAGSGITGASTLSARVFNQALGSASANFAIASNGAFSLSLRAGVDFGGFVSANGTFNFAVDANRNISVSFSGRFSAFGLVEADISGSANTATGSWSVSGSLSFGERITWFGGRAGVSLSLSLRVSNADFSLSARGSAYAYVAGIGDSISVSASINSRGTLSVEVLEVSLDINLKTGKVSTSEVAGATVFLDTNFNGILDPGEVSTIADETGVFSFAEDPEVIVPVQVAVGDSTSLTPADLLGALAPHDLNENGIIDANEGTLRVTGGRDFDAVANTATHALENNSALGVVPYLSAEVFLDLNNNGQLDPGEPVTLSGAGGVYSFRGLDESFSRNLGTLAPFDTNGNGLIDPQEGVLVREAGELIPNPLNLPTDELSLLLNNPSGPVPYRDATIFLDLNGNGVRDTNELSTTTDALGFYDFLPASAITTNLGRLAPFDTNGNGVIDPEEGVFVATGGTDTRTGAPNTQTIAALAVNAGTGFNASVSQISNLQQDLVRNLGYTVAEANGLLADAFGLNPDFRADNFLVVEEFVDDAQTGGFVFVEDEAKMLGTSSILTNLNIALEQLLAEQRPDLSPAETDALIARAINLAAIEAVAQGPTDEEERQLGDDGVLRDFSADLDLTDIAFVTEVMAKLEEAAAINVNPLVTNAIAATVSAVNSRAQAHVAQESTRITSAFARLKLLMQEDYAADLDRVLTGQLDEAAFIARYTGDSLAQLVRDSEIVVDNGLPVFSLPAQLDLAAGGGRVPLSVIDPDGLPRDLTLSIQRISGLTGDYRIELGEDGRFFLVASAGEVLPAEGQVELLADDQDARGNTVTANLSVRLVPTASVSAAELAGAGETLTSTFTISLNAPAPFATAVNYTAQSATGVMLASGTVRFAPGQMQQRITVAASNGGSNPADRSQLSFAITEREAVALGQAELTVELPSDRTFIALILQSLRDSEKQRFDTSTVDADDDQAPVNGPELMLSNDSGSAQSPERAQSTGLSNLTPASLP